MEPVGLTEVATAMKESKILAAWRMCRDGLFVDAVEESGRLNYSWPKDFSRIFDSSTLTSSPLFRYEVYSNGEITWDQSF